MRIHHLNCGTLGSPLIDVHGVVHCMVVEADDGLMLIDTGFGVQDHVAPSRRMRWFRHLVSAPCTPSETAVRQIEGLGWGSSDVRHIILTHLHLDHAGGLPDFPEAQVHVWRTEYDAAQQPRTWMDRFYDPAHWAHRPRWVLHDTLDRSWFGLPAGVVLKGRTPDIVWVPLPGHTRGHCGIAVATEEGWCFNVGDAASPFHPGTALSPQAGQPYAMRFLPHRLAQRILGRHVERLRDLRAHHPGIAMFSSHDPQRLRELQGSS